MVQKVLMIMVCMVCSSLKCMHEILMQNSCAIVAHTHAFNLPATNMQANVRFRSFFIVETN